MKIVLRGNRVAIEKNIKASTDKTNFLVIPDNEAFSGYIRFLGETASKDLKENQKVYFSTNHQTVRMNGVDYCLMNDSEVFACIED